MTGGAWYIMRWTWRSFRLGFRLAGRRRGKQLPGFWVSRESWLRSSYALLATVIYRCKYSLFPRLERAILSLQRGLLCKAPQGCPALAAV